MSTLSTGIGDYIRIVDIPNKETVLVGRDLARTGACRRTSQYRMKKVGIDIVRSRRYAKEHGAGRSEKVVFTYDLDAPYQEDLIDVRKQLL